ncbi:MAG: hypothetical protein AAF958_05625 [Planctomycetota bacterium]
MLVFKSQQVMILKIGFWVWFLAFQMPLSATASDKEFERLVKKIQSEIASDASLTRETFLKVKALDFGDRKVASKFALAVVGSESAIDLVSFFAIRSGAVFPDFNTSPSPNEASREIVAEQIYRTLESRPKFRNLYLQMYAWSGRLIDPSSRDCSRMVEVTISGLAEDLSFGNSNRYWQNTLRSRLLCELLNVEIPSAQANLKAPLEAFVVALLEAKFRSQLCGVRVNANMRGWKILSCDAPTFRNFDLPRFDYRAPENVASDKDLENRIRRAFLYPGAE